MDITAEMEEYLRLLKSRWFARPPREALTYAAGGEFFGPEMHLAFNAAPYIVIGGYAATIDKAGVRILEIGSGTGYDTAYLKRHFVRRAEITGIERIPTLTRYAAENYSEPGLSFMSADALSLPFGANSFEMVFSVFSIVHTMDRGGSRKCLSEISRVLKPGGRLIFSTPNRELSQDLYHHNPGDLPRLFFCHLLRHEYDREELESLLHSSEEGGKKLFASVSIRGLANSALRPVWEETLKELAAKRFPESGGEAFLPSLARRILPQDFKARYFFGKIRKACLKRTISLIDIAREAKFYPEGENESADHFIVIAKKE